MRRASRLVTAYLLAGVAAMVTSSASAQPTADNSTQAQRLFDEGLALMKAGKYAEACPKLQQSQGLDPAMGTQYRLAECYRDAGLTGSAWVLFTEVAEQARKAGRADRESQARAGADALKPRLPMMTVTLAPAIAALPGFELKRDGEPIAASDFNRKAPVDPGAHTVVATATRKKPWQQTVRILEGGAIEVRVPALDDDATATTPAVVPPVAAHPPAVPVVAPPPVIAPPETLPVEGPSPGRTPRIVGVVVGVVGLAGVGVGAAMGVTARSQWNDALTHCQGGDKTKCDAQGIALGSDTSRSATISTAGFIVGGAGIAAGLILILTAPSKKAAPRAGLQVTPTIGRDTAFLSISSVF